MTMRKGFTLIELLIVIIVISSVYYLGFETFEIDKPKPKALTPVNLKTEIISSDLYNGETTLLCLDNCRSCYIRSDSASSFQTYNAPINLHNLKVYTLDASEALIRMEYGRYKDKEICLVIDFYSNGSSTPLILMPL